ncbi:DUF1152 domain-containing protein [bacterium]|nr:DUF1152 domain-containing protein [bacterium]
MFGEKKIEFDRTYVGVKAIEWLLKGDYASFTECQDKQKLTPESFQKMSDYARSIIKDDQALDAMITFMVINDLGKIKKVVDQLAEQTGTHNVDHDKILLEALEKNGDKVSPSYGRLSPEYQHIILDGLRSQFNAGQFMQAECPAAGASGVGATSQRGMDFQLLHAVCDIAGVAGQTFQNGCKIMTQPTWDNFDLTIQALDGLKQGKTVPQAFDQYLSARAQAWGMKADTPEEKAITRLNCMLRTASPEDAHQLAEVFHQQPLNTRRILTAELNRNGVDDGLAILPYYSPAMFSNIQNGLKAEEGASPETTRKGLGIGMETLGRAFQAARISIKDRPGNGVFTLFMGGKSEPGQPLKLAEAATKPAQLGANDMQLKTVGEDAEVELVPPFQLDASRLKLMQSLSELPARRYAVVGIGGGSDCLQAAQLGLLLEKAGKHCSAVISVRTAQTPDGPREVKNPLQVLQEGRAYQIGPETSGNGRFLENLPAQKMPTFLALEAGDDQLPATFAQILKAAGNPDGILAVDTGGDCLYSTNPGEQATATPDQDLTVLKALSQLPQRTHSAVVALGVDAPKDAQSKLERAGAQAYPLSSDDKQQILGNYQDWGMDGSQSEKGLYGKTVFAWQHAMKGESGVKPVELPEKAVLSKTNPWNPYVRIDPSMNNVLFMDVNDHLKSLEG